MYQSTASIATGCPGRKSVAFGMDQGDFIGAVGSKHMGEAIQSGSGGGSAASPYSSY